MKNININNLYRKDLANFIYWPLLPSFLETEEYKKGFLKLDTGENIFDVPQTIMSKLKTLKIKYYPGVSDELVTLLAEKNNIAKQNIFLGNGTLDLLDLVIRLFVDPGDEVITCSPTYPLYCYFVQLARGKNIVVPRKNYTEVDIEKIKKSITNKTKMIIVDNPSNPFGYVVSQDQIKSLLNLGVIVIIDEAYYEFYGKTAAPLLKEYSNLIVLRTFSKAMAMAGMRLAYLMSSKNIKESLVKIKTPYQTNIASQFIGKELLKNVNITKQIQQLIAGREYLLNELKQFTFLEVYPSQGAYVVLKINSIKISSDNLYEYFYKNKMLIKRIDYPTLGKGFLRINIVPVAIAKKIITVLRNYEI